MRIDYTPYPERMPDYQYQGLLKSILENGVETETQQGERALTLMGPNPLHYKLKNGFPVITERNMAPKVMPIAIWQQAIGEIFAFINGIRTLEGLHSFGCFFWDKFITEKKCSKRELETGDIGPGSYGGGFHDFPTPNGPFNQFAEIIEEIKDAPHLRTFFITDWIPYYIPRRPGKIQKVVVAPCHGVGIHIRILEGKLTLHMFQRSADVVLGVPSNICQYAALTMALAQVLGYEAFEYIHSFSDAHIYTNQLSAVETMINREPRPFPTMLISEEIENLFDFRLQHFLLLSYNPWPGIKGIPLSI